MIIVPNALLSIIFLIVILAGIIMLQIFLSKRRHRWIGLVLPIINVIFSMLVVLGMVFYENKSITQIIIQVIMIFVLWNIPTIILIAVYFACRENIKKNKEIDRIIFKIWTNVRMQHINQL